MDLKEEDTTVDNNKLVDVRRQSIKKTIFF